MKTLLLSLSVLWCAFHASAQISTTEVVESGASRVLQDPYSITLKPGFWAKSGSVFHARIGYEALNEACRIITTPDFAISYINPNSYSPEAIAASLKLQLTYDTAGNMDRLYFDQTQGGIVRSTDNDLERIASLIYVYPNPTSGQICVAWDDSVDYLIHAAVLVTPSAVRIPIRIVQTGQSREGTLNFEGPLGTYFLRIQLTDERIISKTLLKH